MQALAPLYSRLRRPWLQASLRNPRHLTLQVCWTCDDGLLSFASPKASPTDVCLASVHALLASSRSPEQQNPQRPSVSTTLSSSLPADSAFSGDNIPPRVPTRKSTASSSVSIASAFSAYLDIQQRLSFAIGQPNLASTSQPLDPSSWHPAALLVLHAVRPTASRSSNWSFSVCCWPAA